LVIVVLCALFVLYVPFVLFAPFVAVSHLNFFGPTGYCGGLSGTPFPDNWQVEPKCVSTSLWELEEK
jgi:hypothetical protein